MHCWVFGGEPISCNPSFFTIIIIDPEVSLKGFANFKLTRLRLCSTNILLDACSGGMRYFNRLVLGIILLIFVFLTFLEILRALRLRNLWQQKRSLCGEEKYLDTSVI